MKIEPIGKNLLLSQDENYDHSQGGILLPGSMVERDYQGKVVDIGDEVTFFGVGDYVVFKAGKCQHMAGKLLVHQDDILARVKL